MHLRVYGIIWGCHLRKTNAAPWKTASLRQYAHDYPSLNSIKTPTCVLFSCCSHNIYYNFPSLWAKLSSPFVHALCLSLSLSSVLIFHFATTRHCFGFSKIKVIKKIFFTELIEGNWSEEAAVITESCGRDNDKKQEEEESRDKSKRPGCLAYFYSKCQLDL